MQIIQTMTYEKMVIQTIDMRKVRRNHFWYLLQFGIVKKKRNSSGQEMNHFIKSVNESANLNINLRDFLRFWLPFGGLKGWTNDSSSSSSGSLKRIARIFCSNKSVFRAKVFPSHLFCRDFFQNLFALRLVTLTKNVKERVRRKFWWLGVTVTLMRMQRLLVTISRLGFCECSNGILWEFSKADISADFPAPCLVRSVSFAASDFKPSVLSLQFTRNRNRFL